MTDIINPKGCVLHTVIAKQEYISFEPRKFEAWAAHHNFTLRIDLNLFCLD